MTVRKQRATQTATGAWAGDSTIQVNLDRKGAITRIYATAEVTPSATLGGATSAGGSIWHIAQNLVIAGGGQTYFQLPADDACKGGLLLHYLNRYDGFGVGHPMAVITAPRRTYTPLTYVLHAGTRPKDACGRDNPFDMTAFIPAVSEGQLRADWVTSGNDVMDDVVTISSATLRFTLCFVMGEEAELLEEMAGQDIMQGSVLPPGVKAMIPAWTAERFPHTATQTSYNEERNVPAGGWLSHIALVDQDDTATRSLLASDQVTGIAIKESRFGFDPIAAFVDCDQADHPLGDNLVVDDGVDLGGAAPHGVFVKDLTRHATTPWGREYGMNMGAPGVGVGDVKLGLTVSTYAAGDDSLIIYRRRLPVSPGTRIP